MDANISDNRRFQYRVVLDESAGSEASLYFVEYRYNPVASIVFCVLLFIGARFFFPSFPIVVTSGAVVVALIPLFRWSRDEGSFGSEKEAARAGRELGSASDTKDEPSEK